jgi:hypothetical protein
MFTLQDSADEPMDTRIGASYAANWTTEDTRGEKAVTEVEWLNSSDPAAMLLYLRDRASKRKLRLFACALARRAWSLLSTERIRRAVEAAERFADGAAPKREMTAAGAAAQQAAWTVSRDGPRFKDDRTAAAFAIARDAAYAIVWEAATLACREAKLAEISAASRRAVLRDIFGNPFRPVSISSAVLAWNDAVVSRLAQSAYEERELPAGTLDNGRLAVLADALEEAGCTDADILAHLRGPGPHVCGCWAIDAILLTHGPMQ